LTSVALGLAFGIVSVLWLGFIFNDTIIEISLTLAVSYIAFFTVRSLVYPAFNIYVYLCMALLNVCVCVFWIGGWGNIVGSTYYIYI
jgi:hypothetical protein